MIINVDKHERMKNIIRLYLAALESGNAENVLQLFSDDAIIHSPLYGDLDAKAFFKGLFADTNRSAITLLNMFTSMEKPDVCAAQFMYEWVLNNGIKTSFECVDIFHINAAGKIKELAIIYDTNSTRAKFERRG